MLTHLHVVVYTWWCWHIYKGGGVPRVERGVGSSLPLAELARRDSALLRKLSAYFLLRRWEFLEKSRECFSLKNTHRTLASGAPDAESERPVQAVPGPARVRHRTLAPNAGTGRWAVTVRASGGA